MMMEEGPPFSFSSRRSALSPFNTRTHTEMRERVELENGEREREREKN